MALSAFVCVLKIFNLARDHSTGNVEREGELVSRGRLVLYSYTCTRVGFLQFNVVVNERIFSSDDINNSRAIIN